MEPEISNGGEAAMAGGFGVMQIIYLVLIVVYIIGLWKVFVKAGEPGWAAIVPIYNLIVWVKIAGKPTWYVLLLLCTGPIGAILIGIAMAERFGKSQVFGIVALGLFPYVGYPILGFGQDQYTPPSA